MNLVEAIDTRRGIAALGGEIATVGKIDDASILSTHVLYLVRGANPPLAL